MVKKIVSLSLTAVLCMSMLAGCSKKPASGGDVVQQPNTPQVEQTAKTTLTVTEPGSVTPEGSVKEVIIEAGGVTIENAKLDKVVISPKVGDGDVTLSGINAKSLTVNGGGKNSVHINKSNFDNVEVKRAEGAVRLVVGNDSSVKNLSLQSAGGILEVSGAVDSLEISKDAKDSTLSIAENAKVFAVLVNAVADIKIDSPVETLTLSQNAEGANVEIAKQATVKTLATDVKINITGNGTIEKAITDSRANIVSTIRPQSTSVVDVPVSGGRPADVDSDPTPVYYPVRPTPTPAPPAPAPEPEPEAPAATPVPKINLTVKSLTLEDKPYDGFEKTKVTAKTVVFDGLVAGDVVTLDLSDMMAHIADPTNVGNDKVVTLTGNAKLAGKDAGKYTLTNSGLSGTGDLKVNVIKSNVVIVTTNKEVIFNNTAIPVDDMFKSTTTDGVVSYGIIIGGDTTGEGNLSFDKLTVTKAGTFKIKFATTDTAKYNAGEATAILTVKKMTGDETPPKLVEDATVDATDEIAVTKGDDQVTFAFGADLAHSDYEYLITATGLDPSTAWTAFDANNLVINNLTGAKYDVQVRKKATDKQEAGASAKLTVEINIALTVTGTVTVTDRVYAANDTSATITFKDLTLTKADSTVINSSVDKVSLLTKDVSATFDDENAGENKPVTLSGNVTLTGDNAANYTLVEADSAVLFEDVRGTISKAAVTNTAKDNATVVYDPDKKIDVSSLFELDTNAGAATYTVTFPDSDAGIGTIADGKTLTVTKAGKFIISVTTAVNGNYAAGDAVSVTLTVEKATRILADLIPVAETSDGAANGKITGLNPNESYKYKLSTAQIYTEAPEDATVIQNLAPGIYNVVLLGNDLYNDSEAVDVIIDAYVAPIAITVSNINFKDVAYDQDGKYTLEVVSQTFTVDGSTESDSIPATVKLDVNGMTIVYPTDFDNAVGSYTITLTGAATLTGEGSEKYTLKNADLTDVTLPQLEIVAAPVTNTAKDDATVVYDPDKKIDVSSLFELDTNAGAATYTVAPVLDAAGSLDTTDGKTLNVTKAGKFIISVTTAVSTDGNYAAGAAVSVTLTVKKADGPTTAPSLVTTATDADNEILLTTDGNGNIKFTIGNTLSNTAYEYSIGNNSTTWATISSGTAIEVTSQTTEGANVTVTVRVAETDTHNAGATATATITPLAAKIELTVTGTLKVASKVYDGGTTAILDYTGLTLSTTGESSAVVSDLTVNVDGLTANFDDPNVGTGKIITITGTPVITIEGDTGNKYKLATNHGLVTNGITGEITQATPKIIGNDNTVTYAGDKIIDVSSLFGDISAYGTATYTVTFPDSDAGIGTIADGKTLTVTKAGKFIISVATAANGNYAAGDAATATLTVEKGVTEKPTLNATAITADALTSRITINNYDPNRTYQYKIGDGVYQNTNGSTITNLDAGTYTVKITATNLFAESASDAVTIVSYITPESP